MIVVIVVVIVALVLVVLIVAAQYYFMLALRSHSHTRERTGAENDALKNASSTGRSGKCKQKVVRTALTLFSRAAVLWGARRREPTDGCERRQFAAAPRSTQQKTKTFFRK